MKKKILITFGIILIALLFLSSKNPYRRDYNMVEAPIQVEKWMTTPFVDYVEEPLEVEEWMTKPFTNN